MKDSDGREAGETGLDNGPLPEVLERLCDAMHGVDANWNLEDWLIKKAEEEIELLRMDLSRERLLLEQRLHRVEAISNRMDPVVEIVDTGQRNLFDCFNLEPETVPKVMTRDEADEPHPARILLDYMPGEMSDDPLLAVVAQMVLLEMDTILGKGAEMASIEQIADALTDRGITCEEMDEALDHLLMSGAIHEIEDDCFIPDE